MIDVVRYLNNGLSVANEKTKEPLKEMGKDAFMQLLVTQMSNQNPLEPMNNTEFIGQLAQFSSLEQMQNVASAMEMLALSQTASTNSQMVNLIGKRVITPGKQFTLDANPVELRFNNKGENVQTGDLVIKNKNGQVVYKNDLQKIEKGLNKFIFDGKDQNGGVLEPGVYTYDIVSKQGGALKDITTYGNYLVDAVAFNGTSILLKSGGAAIDIGDISEVLKN